MTSQAGKKVFFSFVLAALLICIGWYANIWFYHRFHDCERRVQLKGFKFISPLIDVELPEGYTVRHEPIPFKDKIAKFVKQEIDSGRAIDISVYFRDLSDGPWFGINENMKYNPASMMKVPVMIAWLKRAEKDPSVLRGKLTFYAKDANLRTQSIQPAKTLADGKSYTVEELLRYMMYYSDNKALHLLYSKMLPEEYDNILASMDVANDRDDEGKIAITAHSYSGFLRVLYNASFLNKEMSEKALLLMSYQDFPMGMAAGIPKGIKLASKFGEYSDSENPRIKQLHEFGIVYHPKGPYILGILTRGFHLDQQADIIRTVSKIVYESVNIRK
jgi:beta-lactamase class A